MRGLKTILVGILFSILCIPAYALPVECVGTATQVLNGADTLFLFRDEIHLRSTIGDVDWFSATGTLVASNTDELYPDEGGYYIQSGGLQSAPFYVFLYSEPQIDSIAVIPGCENTDLRLFGDAKPLTYTRPDGTTGSYARACTLYYNALAWNTEAWVDSAATVDESLRAGYYTLPALYGATPIRLCYDADVRATFGLESACVETELTAEQVRAVRLQLTSLVTARGKEVENEPGRPISQELTASAYSGPLEVYFDANPTPAVQFYTWTVYSGTARIASHTANDLRYTFSAAGNYTVVCKVNNAHCADSMQTEVKISESFLSVPNVFTPNNDGKNEEFRVAYHSLREYHIWIYNRWGKLVYESTDPAKGWDGKINGRPAAVGAYFYVIRALGTDAAKDARYTLKPVYQARQKDAEKSKSLIGVYQLSGDINLLR